MNRWEDLAPDAGLVSILDAADEARGARTELITSGTADDKTAWSNHFADGCARMVANALRSRVPDRLTVLPDGDGSAEPPTITFTEGGETKTKKIDVLIGDLVAGLQIAVSLKGVGFRDQSSLGFTKNVTGRLYELENEARRLHEYRPQASVISLYFVPLGSTDDKATNQKPSGFADIVRHLRAITGRSDLHREREWHRADMSFIGLYVPGDTERFTRRHKNPKLRTAFAWDDPFPRGVVRYFDVLESPPMRGLPVLNSTRTFDSMLEQITDGLSKPSPNQFGYAEPEKHE
jgi:hypothetical protein